MKNCENCNGGCGGCAKQLELTQPELHILKLLGQFAFLPVARRSDDSVPVYLENDVYGAQICSMALACLERKMLVDIDYHAPLKGFDYGAYTAYPLHGSVALTERGQQVLELAELEGVQEE